MGTKERHKKKLENLVWIESDSQDEPFVIRKNRETRVKERRESCLGHSNLASPFFHFLSSHYSLFSLDCDRVSIYSLGVKTLQYPSGQRSGYMKARLFQRSLSKILNKSSKWTVKKVVYLPLNINTSPFVNVTCCLPHCIPECWAKAGPRLDRQPHNQNLNEWFRKL